MPSTAARTLSAMLLTLAFSPAARAQPFDHLQCFRIEVSTPRTKYTADVLPRDPAFPATAGCGVKVPAKLLCVDVRKTQVSPEPPGAVQGNGGQKYLCYKTRCAGGGQSLSLTDQFGTHDLIVVKPRMLCAPVTQPVPVTRCCSLGSACFDAEEAFATLTCPGVSGTLGALGAVCDASTGGCGATRVQGDFCCQCGGAGGFCMEFNDVTLADECFAAGCIPSVGVPCGPVSRFCGGS